VSRLSRALYLQYLHEMVCLLVSIALFTKIQGMLEFCSVHDFYVSEGGPLSIICSRIPARYYRILQFRSLDLFYESVNIDIKKIKNNLV
jgi:hypothetical protein